jgi:hypothetical protein
MAAATIGVALVIGGGAALAAEGGQDGAPTGPPEHVLEVARGAAAQARAAAQEVEDEATGAPQGRGSEAFAARHAALADKHANHPGNAERVHEALAAGDIPAGIGQEQAAAAHAMAQANQALKAAGEKPGRGLGRSNATPDADD